MKKVLIILGIFLMSLTTFGQEKEFSDTSKYVYSQIVGTSKFMSNKVKIRIDFGEELKYFTNTKDYYLIDEKTGKPRIFNSMIDALNFMGDDGWEFIQAFVITMGNQNVYHFMLKKQK